MVDIRDVFLDVGILEPDLAVLVVKWILQDVLHDSVDQLATVEESLV